MRILKKDTARDILVFMTDSSDHVTGKTGIATLTITASKNGGAFGSISPTVTELATGWYKLALTSSHPDTLGDYALHVTGSGADPTDVIMQVCSELPGELSATGVSSIWNALTSGLSTSASIGKLLVDNINATISSRSTLTAANVWDALTSTITTANTIGKLLVDNVNATISSRSTLTAALVWDQLLSAITTASSIGKLIKDNLDVVLSTRLASGSYTAPDNTTITAINAKTTNLPSDPADDSDIDTQLSSISSNLSSISSNLDSVANTLNYIPQATVPQSEEFLYVFPMKLASTGLPATGITPVVKVSKDGGTFATSTNPATEIGLGWYKVTLTDLETTASRMAVASTHATTLQTDFLCVLE